MIDVDRIPALVAETVTRELHDRGFFIVKPRGNLPGDADRVPEQDLLIAAGTSVVRELTRCSGCHGGPIHSCRPRTQEEQKISALEHELSQLRSRHETLGAAYRSACDKLEKQEIAAENLRARLGAIKMICLEKQDVAAENLRAWLNAIKMLCP